MSVTGVAGAERETKLRQVERLIASNVLHGSESLCKLLKYLAEQSIDHPGIGVKEYQIATEVFKRPADFDPRMDSTVRVQTGRLRSKLAEYYAHEGVDDPLIVEIPKGAYALTFHPRIVSPPVEPAPGPAGESTPAPPAVPVRSYKGWFIAVVVLAGLLALSLVTILAMLLTRPSSRITSHTEPPAPLAEFWKDFLDSRDEPLVVYSNAEFVGRPETGMHYYNPQVDKPQPIHDHYTGVGEVLAIHELDRLFASFNHGLRVKRGRLLSMDDAKNDDLIFVGSPSENLSLLEMPTLQDFMFKRLTDGPRKGDLSVTNVHPQPGEARIFLSTADLPLLEDYAVVGLMPGLNPSRWVIVLAGLTTMGTQAAVEYVTHPNTVQELLQKLTGSLNGKVVPFEALIQVNISHGVPVHSKLIAVHARH